MNTFDPSSQVEDWRRYLGALPEVAPDEALWLRLQSARAVQAQPGRWTRRTGRVWGLAAMVLVAVAVVPLMLAPRGDHDGGSEVAGHVTAPSAAAVVDAGLLQIDADIERAYARGADAAEVASLWATRQRVARSLESAAPVLLARL